MTEGVISNLIIAAYYVGVGILIFSILLDNRNPSKTAGYILMLVFLPILGVVIYLYFGQDYRKQKIFNRKSYADSLIIEHWRNEYQKKFEENIAIAEKHDRGIFQVTKLLQKNFTALSLNNNVIILKNGEEKFKDLFSALKKAKHHIHLEYYIIEDDDLTAQLVEILKDKAQQGVEVRVVYDDVGSRKLGRKFLKNLINSGVEIHPFMPVSFPFFTSRANYRDHRKIVVIDGLTGYVGGINISERYLNKTDNKWRDTHLRIDGDAVRQLQIQFMLMWKFVSKKKLPIIVSYYPALPTYNTTALQIAVSGPDSDWASIMLAFFKAITVARKYIYITTPYFIPNDQILTAIQSAALSGVEVKLLIPQKSDNVIVQAAMMSYVKELLASGARVFLYHSGFIHAKTIVIDDSLATIGTANMDYRSFNINFEVNAFIYDSQLASELKQHFYEDLENAHELFLSRWEKRAITKRLVESSARLLAPIL